MNQRASLLSGWASAAAATASRSPFLQKDRPRGHRAWDGRGAPFASTARRRTTRDMDCGHMVLPNRSSMKRHRSGSVQLDGSPRSCRACETITQAPAPFHSISRGRAGPGLLAEVVFSKFGLHLPLHRQRCRAHRAHRWNRRSRPRRTRSSAPARMCRPRLRHSALRRAPASAELSGGALELPHQLLAEALAPLGVEAAPPQLFLEGLGVYVVEDEALRRELVA